MGRLADRPVTGEYGSCGRVSPGLTKDSLSNGVSLPFFCMRRQILNSVAMLSFSCQPNLWFSQRSASNVTKLCREADGLTQTLVATQLLYYCAQTTIKLAILLLYNRVFGVNRKFRMALYVYGALVVMWWVASFLDTIFMCTPVQASWDKSIQNARCQNIRNAALATGVSNLILDIMILAMPLPVIWGLQASKRVKVSLTFIFLLGGL